MNDLNTINRLNAERHYDTIATARAAGKHVLVYRAGLHIVNVCLFDTAEDVKAVADSDTLSPAETREYLAPTVQSAVPIVRDQSEDRTLADYVGHVTQTEAA